MAKLSHHQKPNLNNPERGDTMKGKFVLGVLLALGLAFVSLSQAGAAISVTPATGGSAISADDYADSSLTALTGPTIVSGAANDIVTSLIILAPANFRFAADSIVTATLTNGGATTLKLADSTVTPTSASDSIVFAVTTASGANDSVIISGLYVFPINTLPVTSNIQVDPDGGGTTAPVNAGALTIVHGAATKLAWTTQPNSPRQAGQQFTTGTVTVQDQWGNTVTTGADSDAVITVKAYRSDNWQLSTGFWNEGTIANSTGVIDTATLGAVDFAANPKFDFSKAGGYYFIATASGAGKAALAPDTSNAITITFNQTPGDMTVDLTAPITMEVNTYSAVNVSAVLRDKYNNPVADSTIVFQVTYGTGGYFRDNSSTACTVAVNLSGYGAATYNSGNDVSTGDSIKVYLLANGSEVSGVNDKAGITLTPGALTTVDVTPEDYGVTNANERVEVDSTSGWFTAELQDYWGNHIDAQDVAGKRILVRVDGPSSPWTANRYTTPELYGGTGSFVWRFKYIAGQTVTTTPDTILVKNDADTTIYDEVYAKVIGGPISDVDTLFTLTWHAPDDSAVTVCDDSSNTINFDIVAKDKYGNLTENRVINYSLTGTVNYGDFAASADTTDASGAASGTYQAGSKAQLVTLTATAAVGSATASKLIALEAKNGGTNIASISIASSAGNTISAGQTTNFTFTYYDQFGNVVDFWITPPSDTSWTNKHADIGTLYTATTTDTINSLWPRVFGVTRGKTYRAQDTLTVAKWDTIIAVANSKADTFALRIVPAGELDYFTISYSPSSRTATVNNWITLTLYPYDGNSNQIFSYHSKGLAFAFNGAADSSRLWWEGTGETDSLTESATGAYLPDTVLSGGSFQIKVKSTYAEGATITISDTNSLSTFTTQNTSTLTWTPGSLDSFAVVAQSAPIYTGTPFTVTVNPQDVYDNTITATSYWIDFSANEQGVTLPNGTQHITGATDYQVTAANPSTTLQLTVTEHDNLSYFGTSAPITVLAVTLASPTIDSLYDISSDQGTRVRMRFTGSADELGGIYKIQRKIVAKSTNWDDVLDLEAGSDDGVYNAVVPTLQDSVWSWFRVLYARVIGDNTYYAISAVDSVMSVDDIPPTAAQFVQAMDTPGDVGGSITVTWNLSSSDGIVRPAQGIFPEVYGVSEYWIYRDGDKVGTVAAGNAEYSDVVPENYPTTYSYTVYAYDGSNLSEVSNTEGAYAADNTQIADFTSDGYVDVGDLSKLADQWHTENTALAWDDLYDLVADGYIDVSDLSVMADHWHEGTPAQLTPGPNAEAEVTLRHADGSTPNQLVVEIGAGKVNNLSGYEFTLSYNPDQLTFLKATGGELLNSLGGETPVLLSASNPGELKLANVIAGVTQEIAPEGDGVIARISFRMEEEDADLRLDDICFMDVNGTKDVIPSPTEVDPFHIGSLIPRVYSLSQNYPNPFNPTTEIMYGLPKDSQVELKVFNIMGQEVTTLVNGWQKAGYRSVGWDGTDNSSHPVASGVYFYRLRAGEFNSIKRMVLLK